MRANPWILSAALALAAMSACSSSYEPQQTASPLHTSEITENSSVQPDNSRPDLPAGYNMNVLYPTFT